MKIVFFAPLLFLYTAISGQRISQNQCLKTHHIHRICSYSLDDSLERIRYFDITLLDDSGLVQAYIVIKREKDSLGMHEDTISLQKQFYDVSGRLVSEKFFRNGKISDSVRFTWSTNNYCTRQSYSADNPFVYSGISRQKGNVWRSKSYKNRIWQSTYIEKYRQYKTILIYKRKKGKYNARLVIYLNARGDAEKMVTKWRHKIIVGYVDETDENGAVTKTKPTKAKRTERKFTYEYDDRGLITKRVEGPDNEKELPTIRVYEYSIR